MEKCMNRLTDGWANECMEDLAGQMNVYGGWMGGFSWLDGLMGRWMEKCTDDEWVVGEWVGEQIKL